MTNLEFLKELISNPGKPLGPSPFDYPPPIAKTLGFELVDVGPGTATLQMQARTDVHANPMGTIHGGVLCDVADATIGTAHSTTLLEGESFTSVDLQINFFRPVWNETIRSVARPVHSGKTVSRYVCDLTRGDGKLIAQVTSTVMTLRGGGAAGR
jgi:uncharacterized protein (TIGR00369 family)